MEDGYLKTASYFCAESLREKNPTNDTVVKRKT
jgi:hypothetical protein